MASSLGLLQEYGSDDDASSPKSSSDEHNSGQRNIENIESNKQEDVQNYNKENFEFDPSLSIVSKISVDAAPLVLYSNDHDESRFIDENTKELM